MAETDPAIAAVDWSSPSHLRSPASAGRRQPVAEAPSVARADAAPATRANPDGAHACEPPAAPRLRPREPATPEPIAARSSRARHGRARPQPLAAHRGAPAVTGRRRTARWPRLRARRARTGADARADAAPTTAGTDAGAPQPRRSAARGRRRSPPSSLVGAVVGLLGRRADLALAAAASVVAGTDSCGGARACSLLVAIAGRADVRSAAGCCAASGSPTPGSTSFLGVGLLAVVALLFLIDSTLTSWSDASVAVPVGRAWSPTRSSWRVTTTLVDAEATDQRAAALSERRRRSSAICTVLSAAPLRRLSLLMNSASPRSPSTPGSWRIRPTYDGSLPAACSGVGTSRSSTPGASAAARAPARASSAARTRR